MVVGIGNYNGSSNSFIYIYYITRQENLGEVKKPRVGTSLCFSHGVNTRERERFSVYCNVVVD